MGTAVQQPTRDVRIKSSSFDVASFSVMLYCDIEIR